ncbi:MAG: thiamine-phosphate kinase [Candidatus Omnitrophica bacterium]|nr:thiamine-phosphate kinase [Candidatus Omnitrophota bacterium]
MPARVADKMRLSDLGEFGLIDRIRKQVKGLSAGVVGIGDDAAVVPLSSGKYLLLTTDMLVEGVHFTLAMPARGIGHKAIASSVSDIAAMGGVPKYAVVSLAVPPSLPCPVVSQMYQGMIMAARKFGVEIVGGDTVKGQKVIINVALTGEVKKNEVVYRHGARAGDRIFVTGPLGRSLKSGRHLRFVPRVLESQYLVKRHKPTAMIDISDGLVADLGHILAESRVGAVIEGRAVPRRREASLKEALYDGEDFELLFTLSPSKAKGLEKHNKSPFRVYRIGEIVSEGEGLQMRTTGGLKRLKIKGYTHF